MTFLYHHRTAGRGAEGNHILSLVHALEADAHSVVIISPPGVDPRSTAGATPLDKGAGRQTGISRLWQMVSCRCPGVVFELIEVAYNFYALCRLTPLLWRHRLTAAYYERYAFFTIAGVALARLFGLPVILEVNEVTGVHRARRQILIRLSRWFENQIFRCASRVITVSSFLTSEVIQRGATPNAVLTIPNGIHPERFNVLGGGAIVRTKYGLHGTTVLGFVGWFDDWDRLDLLIDVVRKIAVSHPHIRLMLVGDGPVMGQLRRQVDDQNLTDRVIFTGAVQRQNVPLYIDAMDICVLPDSNPYGSPMALIEFMAMGKAVIAPDLLPVRDVIRDGENGRIVERHNPEVLRQAIVDLTDDPQRRARLGAQARQDVLTQRTWASTARKVTTLVQEIRKGASN